MTYITAYPVTAYDVPEPGHDLMTRPAARAQHRSPSEAEQARLAALRAQLEQEFPPGEAAPPPPAADEPETLGEYFSLRRLIGTLRQAREAQGLKLSEVAVQAGLDETALRRIETGEDLNPSLQALSRYAKCVGKRLEWSVTDV